MNIGIFICGNGLGHIRRVSAILHYLLNIKNDRLTSVRFTIHLPVKSMEYLKNWEEIQYLNKFSLKTIAELNQAIQDIFDFVDTGNEADFVAMMEQGKSYFSDV